MQLASGAPVVPVAIWGAQRVWSVSHLPPAEWPPRLEAELIPDLLHVHPGAIRAALDADYLELANSQYYSWAHLNRAELLPSREQIERAERELGEIELTLLRSFAVSLISPLEDLFVVVVSHRGTQPLA